MQLYSLWFPGTGQDEGDADIWGADSPPEAAEKAASSKCRRDVEWRDLVVAARLPGGETTTFDVVVVSRPEFTARERLQKHPEDT